MNTLEFQLKFLKGEAVSYSSSNYLWPRREPAPILKLGMNYNIYCSQESLDLQDGECFSKNNFLSMFPIFVFVSFPIGLCEVNPAVLTVFIK